MYWVVALLALAEFGIGWSLGYLSGGSQGMEITLLVHMALGIVLAALVIIIPVWRIFSGPPEYPAARPHWLQISLRVSESLLFILLFVTALTGYLSWAFSGGATPSWSQWLPSSLPLGHHAGAMFNRWHELSAIAVAVPIIGTLGLLSWGALKGHRMPHLIPHHRRVLVPPEKAGTAAPAKQPEAPPAEDRPVQRLALARHLKIFGSIAFWGQLCLGLIAVLLLVVTTSSSYYEENLPTLPYGFSWADGIVWAYLALGVLALTVMGFYSCILFARSLKRGEVPEGGGAGVRRLISTISVGNALGLTLAILGTAFSIALLISKTVSQPPGIAITDPQAIVRAVDVFVLLANFDIVVAHFIGMLICLWMLNRLHHFDIRPEPTGA